MIRRPRSLFSWGTLTPGKAVASQPDMIASTTVTESADSIEHALSYMLLLDDLPEMKCRDEIERAGVDCEDECR
jgi:hypothetical protein